jgi:hypothetical protein
LRRARRDPLELTLERARRKFRVGDRVRDKHSGHIGVVASRPGENGGYPAHLYVIKLQSGEVRPVHPLLLVLVEDADQSDCN